MNTDFATNLRTAMNNAGLNVRELGNLIGFEEDQVELWLQGAQPTSGATFELTQALDVSYEQLFFGEERPRVANAVVDDTFTQLVAAEEALGLAVLNYRTALNRWNDVHPQIICEGLRAIDKMQDRTRKAKEPPTVFAKLLKRAMTAAAVTQEVLAAKKHVVEAGRALETARYQLGRVAQALLSTNPKR